MATCPPFCVFVNSVGVTSKLATVLPFSLNRANIFTDIPHLSQWYWMLCRITIDLFYTINGNFAIHHTYTMDNTQVLPSQRILPGTTKFSLKQRDTSLEITTTCDLDGCDVYMDEAFLKSYNPNRKDYEKNVLLPPQTKVGLFFNFIERADNGDFSLTTIKNFSHEKLLHTFNANFIGHTLPFYLTTEYPDDIEGKIDNIILKHEFFKVEEERL